MRIELTLDELIVIISLEIVASGVSHLLLYLSRTQLVHCTYIYCFKGV